MRSSPADPVLSHAPACVPPALPALSACAPPAPPALSACAPLAPPPLSPVPPSFPAPSPPAAASPGEPLLLFPASSFPYPRLLPVVVVARSHRSFTRLELDVTLPPPLSPRA